MYESAANLAAELAVVEELRARGWAFDRAFKIKHADYGADFALAAETERYGHKIQLIKAVVEVKVRTNPFGKFTSYMLSMRKMRAAQLWPPDVCPLLAVKWSDGYLGWCKLREATYTVGWNGRRDRHDNSGAIDGLDVEPVAYIPLSQFKVYPPLAMAPARAA